MAPQMDDEPRYGQRSSESEPLAAPSPNGNGGAASPSSPQTTPWPQYGAVNAQAGPAYGSYPGAQAQPDAQAPGADSPFVAQGSAAPHAAPANGPQAWAAGYPAPALKLPGRVGPVLLMVIGVIVAVIVAPIALVVGTLGGMNMSSLFDSMVPVSSGDTVLVDQSGTYIVTAQSGDIRACELSSPTGVAPMEPVGSGAFVASNLEEGAYILECQTEGATRMVGITGMSVDTIAGAGLTGLLVATVVGLIGLAMLIGGIVWIVIVNRRRREILERSGFRR